MKQTFLLLFPIWEKWGLILDHYLMNVTQLANLACPQILSSIIWILKLGVVWSALIHLSYNLPQAKNKIKPWYQFGNILLGIKKNTGEGLLILVNLAVNLVTVVLIFFFFTEDWRQRGKISLLKGVFFNKPSCWQIKWQASLSPADSLAGSLLTCALGQTDWFNWQSCLKTCRGIDAEWIISSAIFSSLNAAMQPKALKTVLFIVEINRPSDYFHFIF